MTCDHAALKRDPVRWAALPLVGRMPTYDDAPGAARELEMRTCTVCRSTIGVEIKEES